MKKYIITLILCLLLSSNVLAHDRKQLCQELESDLDNLFKVLLEIDDNEYLLDIYNQHMNFYINGCINLLRYNEFNN